MRPPKSDDGIVSGSTNTTPPWSLPSCAQLFRTGGIVFRSQVTSVTLCLAASSRTSSSAKPRNRPSSHSVMQRTNIRLDFRRRPSATSGEICSSRSDLSISPFSRAPAHDELLRLWEHPRQCLKVHSVVLSDGCLDLLRKRLGVVQGGLGLCFRPAEML